ncbi:MAG: hypothetical protein Q9186_001197 [Xanthomendoza sp. 1 TL-2023]
MDVYDSLNHCGPPSQPLSFTQTPIPDGLIFQPNDFDTMISNQSSNTDGSTMGSRNHDAAPTPPSMPVQRYRSNTGPISVIPPAATSVQEQQHGSHANTSPNSITSVASMAEQQHSRAHASGFHDSKVALSAKLIHQGLTSHASNDSSSGLQLGISHFVEAMQSRMHHAGLVNRVAKFLDSFTVDRNNTITVPADQAMYQLSRKWITTCRDQERTKQAIQLHAADLKQLQEERDHHRNVAVYLNKELKKAHQQIDQQNKLVDHLRASINTLTKDGAPKALSAREVIMRHAALHPSSIGCPRPLSYQTVGIAQNHLHASPTGLPVPPPSMLATPPPFKRPNQPQKEVIDPVVPPKPSLQAAPNMSIDLTSEDTAEAIKHAGPTLPNHPAMKSQSPAAAYQTPDASPAAVLDEVNEAGFTINGKTPQQHVYLNPTPEGDWQSEVRWALYPPPIPQSHKVQAWMQSPTVLQQKQQQAGQKRNSEHLGLIAPFAELTRPIKKAKTTEAAPTEKASRKAPAKQAAPPKKTEPRRKAPRRSKMDKLLEAESWTPAKREEQRILLGQPKSPSPAPAEPPKVVETITIVDEVEEEDDFVPEDELMKAFDALEAEEAAAEAAGNA